MIRDAACADIGGPASRRSVYWLMKFYPLAFSVWTPEKGSHTLDYRDLATYRISSADDIVDLMIDLEPVPHELILEAPTTTQIIMFGRDSIVANGRAPRGQIIHV